MNVVDKIKEIGITEGEEKYDQETFSKVEKQLDIIFPSTYVQLLTALSDFKFAVSTNVKSLQPIPGITIENNLVPLGNFLTLNEGKNSLMRIKEMYNEQIPTQFIPFAFGESGDLIGFNFHDKISYEVSYWFHEAEEGNDIFKIADNFESLVQATLAYKPDITREEMDKVKHQGPSPKMIELLKKTGKWKGQ